MYEGVDTAVLYDELSYRDVLPVAWRPLESAAVPDAQQRVSEGNVRVLQVCVALDDQGQREKSEEATAIAADIQRLDMKMNLLLDLVGRLLVVNQPRPKTTTVMFNARGAIWDSEPAIGKPGDEGILEIYLRNCVAEPLRLIGRIVAVNKGNIKVKFHGLSEGVSDLLEKLAFRQHRRQVADQRQPRSFDASRTGRFRL